MIRSLLNIYAHCHCNILTLPAIHLCLTERKRHRLNPHTALSAQAQAL